MLEHVSLFPSNGEAFAQNDSLAWLSRCLTHHDHVEPGQVVADAEHSDDAELAASHVARMRVFMPHPQSQITAGECVAAASLRP